MKLLGQIITGVGLVTLFYAFFVYDTAPEGTHNLGLLQEQMMLFNGGGVVVICGVLTLLVAKVLDRLEAAGIIPHPDLFKRPADQAAE